MFKHNRFERQQKQKKKKSCLFILILVIFLLIGFIALKYGKYISYFASIIARHGQPESNGNVNTNLFNISGSIYFVKDNNLWKISGSNVYKLTNSGYVHEQETSEDGQYTIYSKIDFNYSDLFLLNNTTNTLTQLTKNANRYNIYNNLWALDPQISPDDGSILYLSDKNKFSSGVDDLSVYQMNIASKRITELTTGLAYTGGDQDPVYYPINSNYFVYNKYIYLDGQTQPFSKLYLMDIQNQQAYPIAPDNAGTLQPAFSPDGKYIIFTKRESPDSAVNKNIDLYIMPFNLTNIDSSDPSTAFIQDFNSATKLESGINAMPTFSPDGKSIAYLTLNNGSFDLVKIDLTYTTDKVGNSFIKADSPQMLTTNSEITSISRISWTN